MLFPQVIHCISKAETTADGERRAGPSQGIASGFGYRPRPLHRHAIATADAEDIKQKLESTEQKLIIYQNLYNTNFHKSFLRSIAFALKWRLDFKLKQNQV